MKHLMLVCLLVVSAAAVAQTTDTAKRGGKASEVADVQTGSADEAKREAEEAKIRMKLDEARARLDKAAQEVAESRAFARSRSMANAAPCSACRSTMPVTRPARVSCT